MRPLRRASTMEAAKDAHAPDGPCVPPAKALALADLTVEQRLVLRDLASLPTARTGGRVALKALYPWTERRELALYQAARSLVGLGLLTYCPGKGGGHRLTAAGLELVQQLPRRQVVIGRKKPR